MRVKDYMTTAVFYLKANRGLVGAKEIMGWAHVRHVPVVDEKRRVVGVVSHRDLVRATAVPNQADGGRNASEVWSVPVEQVMSRDVRTIAPDASIRQAARAMREGKFGCLPVVDAEGVLVGIITEHDLLWVVEALAPDPDAAVDVDSGLAVGRRNP
ncbi:MAG: CBS domain-containing protein [Gemmatimonadota bacterium]|nr:CBS domain-containing protein [Gemmatimonadota bacterium]